MTRAGEPIAMRQRPIRRTAVFRGALRETVGSSVHIWIVAAKSPFRPAMGLDTCLGLGYQVGSRRTATRHERPRNVWEGAKREVIWQAA
jgi:hypothetical protein